MKKVDVKKIVVFGAGGTSRDIIEMIQAVNRFRGTTYECVGILDDDKDLWRKKIMGVKVLGAIEKAPYYSGCFFVNGIYSVNKFFLNESVIKKSKIPEEKFETIIHPSTYISSSAIIGKGCVIFSDVSIMSNAAIGKHVIVLPQSVISHDDSLGNYSFIASGVVLGGYVTVGKSCFIGINAGIKERVNIGDYCVIGMGSNVIRDVPSRSIFVGNPAKFLRKSQ